MTVVLYPFLTLDDNTEIVHSERLPGNQIKVYVEKPDATDGFHSAICYLPEYRWVDINGFSEAEIKHYQEIIESTVYLIHRNAEGVCSQKNTAE